MTTKTQVAVIQDPARREHFVYYAYDARDVLLYIGCTMQPEKRWAGHKAMGSWSRYAVRFRMQGPYNYDTARFKESSAILEHQPPFNGQSPRVVAAKNEEHVFFMRALNKHLAKGMSFDEAGKRALVEVDHALPKNRLYRPLVSA